MCEALDRIEKKGIEIGMEKGIEQGMEKGALKNKIETAMKMIADKMPEDLIARYTGLSLAKIRELESGISA